MRWMQFRCDKCSKEETRLGLPPGWLEVKFFNPKSQRDYFYHACCYSCLVQWAEARKSYYGNKYAENEGHTVEEVTAD